MFKSLRSFLEKISNGRNVLLLLGLFTVFAVGIMPALEADIKALSGGVGVFDLKFYYIPEEARNMLRAYGLEGIRLYLIAEWTTDLIFPVISGAFFAFTLVWIGAKNWYWLAPLMIISDWIENVFITTLLIQYPDFNPIIALATCGSTLVKWSLLIIIIAIIVLHGGKKILIRVSRGIAEVNP